MKKIMTLIVFLIIVVAVFAQEQNQEPDYNDAIYVNQLSPSDIAANIDNGKITDLTIIDSSLLVQAAPNLNTETLVRVIGTRPEIVANLDSPTLTRAVNTDPALMGDSQVYNEIDNRAKSDINILNDNSAIKKEWFRQNGIDDQGGKLASYDGTKVTTKPIVGPGTVTSFNLQDIKTKFPGSILNSAGYLELPNKAVLKDGYGYVDVKGDFHIRKDDPTGGNGEIDLTQVRDPGFTVTVDPGSKALLPDKLGTDGQPIPPSGLELTQGSITTKGDGSYDVSTNSQIKNDNMILNNILPYRLIPPGLAATCNIGNENCAKLGSSTDLVGNGITLNIKRYTSNSGIDKITTYPTKPGKLTVNEFDYKQDGTQVTTASWISGYACYPGRECQKVDDYIPGSTSFTNFKPEDFNSIDPQTNELYAGSGEYCSGQTGQTGPTGYAIAITGYQVASGGTCKNGCGVIDTKNPLIDAPPVNMKTFNCPTELGCGNEGSIFYDPATKKYYIANKKSDGTWRTYQEINSKDLVGGKWKEIKLGLVNSYIRFQDGGLQFGTGNLKGGIDPFNKEIYKLISSMQEGAIQQVSPEKINNPNYVSSAKEPQLSAQTGTTSPPPPSQRQQADHFPITQDSIGEYIGQDSFAFKERNKKPDNAVTFQTANTNFRREYIQNEQGTPTSYYFVNADDPNDKNKYFITSELESPSIKCLGVSQGDCLKRFPP